MKVKLKSLGNFKKKYKKVRKEKHEIRYELDFKFYKSDEYIRKLNKWKEMYRKKADLLTLDLSKKYLCEICKRPKDKRDELRLRIRSKVNIKKYNNSNNRMRTSNSSTRNYKKIKHKLVSCDK